MSKEAKAALTVATGGRKRTVAGRLLASFIVVLLAFAITMGWSFMSLRDAARDAKLVRDAYVPLLSMISDGLADQNVMNTQLNHITAARNPSDVRQWINTARKLRPLTYDKLRQHANKSLSPPLDRTGLREHLSETTTAIERTLDTEGAQFDQLFQLLEQKQMAKAEQTRDDLIALETDVAKQLRALRQRVGDEMASLSDAAERREQRSVQLLIGLSVLTLLVGLLMSLYARRVLAPLGIVTERARAVAAGDLAPGNTVATDDEIGELAETFEGMVAAIRKARAELVTAERLATIGKMAAHITHEVRNPLSSIGLNLELLEEELAGRPADDEAPQLLAAIQSEVERLSRISEQYLAAAREPKLRLQTEDAAEIVRDCHAFVKPELDKGGVVSRVEVKGEIPLIELDEGQLRQALLNLLRNAREVLPTNGEVVLSVCRQGDDVLIEVADNGPGIPDEVRASIFDPFYTTKRHGTGLGLAVTRSIVEAHGGTIQCLPRAEGGTRFLISFPC